MEQLYLVDATAFCYRAFYAIKGLATSSGQPTNAVYGFVAMLNKIMKEQNPQYMAVCFDVSRETFRQKKYAEYKIQRPPMPDELGSQIPIIKQIIKAFGLALLEKEGYEADDIIATLAKKAAAGGFQVTIISSDKDMLQLVDASTVVFNPSQGTGTVYDSQKVFERFGVAPAQITELIALMGDDSDNIPGAKGIGEKTAVELIKGFGSLENLLRDTGLIKQQRLRTIVDSERDTIRLSKDLAELCRDLELDVSVEQLKIQGPDCKELFRLYKQLEFKKLLRDLPVPKNDAPAAGRAEAAVYEDTELSELVHSDGELTVCAETAEEMVFGLGDKVFRIASPGKNTSRVLADRAVKKVGHDLKRTKVMCGRSNIALDGLYFDTMIAAYLLNPSKGGYTLSDVAWDHLGESSFLEESGAAAAVNCIMQLKPALEKKLRESELEKLFHTIEMPLVEVLAVMETNGITIDAALLKSFSRDLEKKLIALIEEIYTLSGSQFNINSPKQLRQILFEKLQLPVIKRSKTGPSTDEEVLKRLASSHALPALLLEYRQLTKLKSTYVDALPESVDPATGKIHTFFNQTGTETGRLSSLRPNLQNLPVKTEVGRYIRRAIIAGKEKNLLLSCDYSQIELRILAHMSADDNLVSAFRNNKDVHRITASLIYNTDEKDVSEEMRETAKRVNFGIIYGLTAYGLAKDLSIPVDAAQSFIDAYFARYPAVRTFINEQISKAQKDGFVTTLLGRRRYIPGISDRNQSLRQFAERQAVNTPIQGSASDLIKLAMVQIHQIMQQKRCAATMILQIHDELLFDVPQNEFDAFAEMVKERMENVLELDVPIKVDMHKGKNWGKMEEVR